MHLAALRLRFKTAAEARAAADALGRVLQACIVALSVGDIGSDRPRHEVVIEGMTLNDLEALTGCLRLVRLYMADDPSAKNIPF